MDKLYFVHALEPLHPGTGQGVGLIDLPVARDRATGHPLLPGSSVKGVLRHAAIGEPLLDAVFGPDRQHADKHGGALCVSDARVLFFPVRSDQGAFAWVTCRYVLERLVRDGGPHLALPDIGEDQAACPVASALCTHDGKLVLEGLVLDPVALDDEAVAALADLVFSPGAAFWNGFFKQHLVVLSDDRFAWMVETATDVRAHIAINPRTGTVESKALWYEETLPAETILQGTFTWVGNGQASAQDTWQLVERVTAKGLQFGGGSTTGLGRARLVVGGAA